MEAKEFRLQQWHNLGELEDGGSGGGSINIFGNSIENLLLCEAKGGLGGDTVSKNNYCKAGNGGDGTVNVGTVTQNIYNPLTF